MQTDISAAGSRSLSMVIAVTWLPLAFSLLATSAWGADVMVNNPSFETPATDPGTFVTNAPPSGWSAYGSLNFSGRTVGVVNPDETSLYADPVPHEFNVGVIFLLPSFTNVEAGMFQTLSATLQTQTIYTLTIEVGNIANDPNPPHNSFNFSGFPGYRIDLLAGGSVIASDNNSLLPAEGRFLTSTVQVTIGASHPNAGQALGIRLVNLDAAPGIEVNFDNVRLDAAPVPTATPTRTATHTPTATASYTATNTATQTATSTPTHTVTSTPSGTATSTVTVTPTSTPTQTETVVPAICPPTPPSDCKTPVPGRGSLSFSGNASALSKSSANWAWSGQSTTLGELGAPLTTTAYRVCIYDGAGSIILDAAAAAAASCDGKPCWKAMRSGFRYGDRAGTSAGLTSLILKAGIDGRAKLRMKARGVHLALPALPLTTAPDPVRAFLIQAESPTCWTAQFSTPVTDPSSTVKWKARND